MARGNARSPRTPGTRAAACWPRGGRLITATRPARFAGTGPGPLPPGETILGGARDTRPACARHRTENPARGRRHPGDARAAPQPRGGEGLRLRDPSPATR